jgi:chromosome transmission fidelity protein 18
VDLLCTFETGGQDLLADGDLKKGTRYGVRQVLEQEWRKEELRLAEAARAARLGISKIGGKQVSESAAARLTISDLEPASKRVARDFFGRPVVEAVKRLDDDTASSRKRKLKTNVAPSVRIAFQEGYSNAVRKPVTLAEFLKDL